MTNQKTPTPDICDPSEQSTEFHALPEITPASANHLKVARRVW